MAKLKTIITTDRDEIREWVEERGGVPSVVATVAAADALGHHLRIDFGDHDEDLNEISWEQFFRIFKDSDFVLAYPEETVLSGQIRAYKLIPHEGSEDEDFNDYDGDEEDELDDEPELDIEVDEEDDM